MLRDTRQRSCAATAWTPTTSQMRASSPPWLADELARSWRAQWPQLPDAMEEAAAYVAPSCAELSRLAPPLGVVAAVDDPIHPLQVAVDWVAAAPRAALRTVTLDEIGARHRRAGRRLPGRSCGRS